MGLPPHAPLFMEQIILQNGVAVGVDEEVEVA